MGQEELNNQQEYATENYQDPIAAQNGEKPAKKSGGAAGIGSTIAAVVVWRLFGLIGGLICFGGFWAVYGICKSKLPLAAKIILSIVVALAFVVLMLVYILVVAALME